MKKTIVFVLSFMLVLCGFVVDSSATNAKETSFKSTTNNLNLYFKKLEETGECSGTVLVMKDDQVLLKEGYGIADYETGRLNEPSTNFHIASMTKAFTAMSIMILEERGMLSIDDKLSQYLPDFPNSENISLHQMLRMTAGIGMLLDPDDEVAWANLGNFHTPMELLQYIENDPPVFEPGEGWAYCNSCYLCLGIIIEQVSGLTFRDFIRINILDPLNMHNTSYDPYNLDFPDKAVGYDNFSTDPPPKSGLLHPTMGYSAGGICSNVNDIWKWQQAFDRKRELLVSSDTLERIFTQGNVGIYGYGWYIDSFLIDQTSHKIFWQYASYLGYHGFIARLDDDGIFILILQNRTAKDIYADDLWMPVVQVLVKIILGNDKK